MNAAVSPSAGVHEGSGRASARKLHNNAEMIAAALHDIQTASKLIHNYFFTV
jgi:hypothetical protein